MLSHCYYIVTQHKQVDKKGKGLQEPERELKSRNQKARAQELVDFFGMAEEFQAVPAGICGGTWWSSLRSVPAGILSPCSSGIGADVMSFPWQYNHLKPRMPCSNNNMSNSSGESNVTTDSSLKIMGLGFSCPETLSSDWNQSIMQGNNGYNSMMQQEMNSNTREPSPCAFTSTLIQSLFEPDQSHHINKSSLFQNNHSVLDSNYMPSTTSTCSNDFSLPTWPKTDPFLKPSSKEQQAATLDITNTPFLNTLLPCSQPQSELLDTAFGQKYASRATTLARKFAVEENQESCRMMVKKANIEPATKRSRSATPSPLPTFKVRKENMRDQITALQQLVSPFGKTDTASVLQEAIEYIKFLHDQVGALSTPYMTLGATVQQQTCEGFKNIEGHKQDLRTRGLCLVPISSTFPVANETTSDFWTPNFGSNHRWKIWDGNKC